MQSKLYFASFGLVFLFLLALNACLPRYGDDVSFFLASNGFSSIIQSFLYWNARFWELIWRGYLVRINPYLFDVLNAFIGSIFIFGLVFLLKKDAKFGLFDICLVFIFLSIMMCALQFEEIFLWGSGSVNYLWGFACIIGFLMPFKIFLSTKKDVLKNKFSIVGFLILTLIAALSHEIGAVFMIIFNIFILIYAKIYKIKLPFWARISLIFAILGFLILFFAPGTNTRSGLEVEKYDFLRIKDLLHLSIGALVSRLIATYHAYFYRIPYFLPLLYFAFLFFQIYKAARYKQIIIFILTFSLFFILLFKANALCFLILALAQGLLAYKNKNQKIAFYLFILWLIFGGIFIQFGSNLPMRSRNFDLMIFIFIILMQIQILLKNKYTAQALLGISVIFFAYSLGQYLALNSSYRALVEYANIQKSSGNFHIVYPREKFDHNYFMIASFWRDPNKISKISPQSQYYNNELFKKEYEKQHKSFEKMLGVESLTWE